MFTKKPHNRSDFTLGEDIEPQYLNSEDCNSIIPTSFNSKNINQNLHIAQSQKVSEGCKKTPFFRPLWDILS